MFGQLASTFILLGSIASFKPANNLRQIETQQVDTQTNENLLYGSYCLRENFELTDDFYVDVLDEPSIITLSYTFSDPANNPESAYAVSLFKDVELAHDYYLQKLDITFRDDHFVLKFYTYDSNNVSSYFDESIDYDDTLSQVINKKIIIYVRNSRYLNDNFIGAFNTIFSHEANSYTTIYNGYYNFTYNGSLLSDKFFLSGTVVFNNTLWMGMSNLGISGSGVKCYAYNVSTQEYFWTTYQYPFESIQVATSTNILMNGCMMSNESYTYLSSVGVFSYVRDTSFDNTTFGDLLFSVMDTPVYFITRLLSFELFGVNMFVAFTGLLTLAVMLVLIKRFF